MEQAQPRWAEQTASAIGEHRPPLSVREGAVYLGVSVAKCWQLVRRGDIESFKIDASRKIMPAALDDYLARQIAAAQAERARVVA
jgi:excisionase family DNA binding protein